MSAESNYSSWAEQAICRGMDMSVFFPATRDGVTKAKKICATCPVSSQCLDYAIKNGLTHGVYGGMGEGQREWHIRNGKP